MGFTGLGSSWGWGVSHAHPAGEPSPTVVPFLFCSYCSFRVIEMICNMAESMTLLGDFCHRTKVIPIELSKRTH